MRKENFIEVNQILGSQPRLGIFTGTQMMTSVVIVTLVYLITNGILALGMTAFLLISTWLVGSWLILIGDTPHEFLDLFQNPPGTDWCNGYLKYVSPLDKRVKIMPPEVAMSQLGEKLKFMPFQNYLDLSFIFTIETDSQKISGYLLNKGKQYQIVWAFNSDGFHHIFNEEEAKTKAVLLERGMKEIPRGEKFRVVWSKFVESSERLEQLDRLIDGCNSSVISILLKNEKGQVKELSEKGIRQKIEKKIFCTWTTKEELDMQRGDPLGNFLKILKKESAKFIDWVTGNESLITRKFYQDLLTLAYERSYLPWFNLLSQRIGWRVKSMNSRECFDYIYKKFNACNFAEPTLAQEWVVELGQFKVRMQEIIASSEDVKTVLIEGKDGIDGTPSHKGSTDTVYLPGLDKLVAVLTLTQKPKGWDGVLCQLGAMWEVLKDEKIRDTEAIVEISTANDYLIKDSLRKLSKDAASRQKRALQKGNGPDAIATVDSDRAFNAAKELYIGTKAVYTATVFLVYREDSAALSAATLELAGSFSRGKLKRERNIAWKIWLECLPITINHLLQRSSWLSDRRLVFDSKTVAGIIPSLVPRDLEERGIELICEGGKPIYFNLFAETIKRILIVGEPGCGKTGLAYRLIVEGLAQNIPVVTIDFKFGNSNSFEYATSLLGDKAAYIDLTKTASNLLEPPDLRSFPIEEKKERFLPWFEQTRATINGIVTWGENNNTLIQRAEALISKSFKLFFEDEDIIERYERAFEGGWRSLAWQKMPVLKDWLKFVTKEQLGLYSYTETDVAAINLIHAQINAFAITSVGQLIGQPSSIPPEPLLKIFACAAMANKKEEYVMANVALSACLRNTMSYSKSLLLGDEIESLLKKEAFGEAVAALCSLGRKTGTNVVLITHGIEGFYNNRIGPEILNSITHRFIGRITRDCANFLVEKWSLDKKIIDYNTSQEYANGFVELFSRWLIVVNDYAWQTKVYLSPMMLGSIANERNEVIAREQITRRYPDTLKGKMLALKEFSLLRKYPCSSQEIGRERCRENLLVNNGASKSL